MLDLFGYVMGIAMLSSLLTGVFTLLALAFAASIPLAVILYFVFDVSFLGPYLMFSAWLYLAFMPFTVIVLYALDNKRAWLGRQQSFKRLDESMFYPDPPESLGFTRKSEKIFGVIYWPWTWLFLRQKETDPLRLLFGWNYFANN
ncbi:MAG: hypothetical protein WCL23_02320 [Candidatus Moraniibacteriota bacterium]